MACRMFGYCGKLEADVHALYAGLKRACAHDPTLTAVAEGCSRHCHGWGYVIHAENGLFHYRTARSIYEDEVVLPKLEGEIRAIFHGRFASNPDLTGHIFSHPFMTANDTEILFLAHNGGIQPDHLPARTVDSEWVLQELGGPGGMAKALPRLKEQTKSALNLLTLSVGRGRGTPASLQYFHFFKPKAPDKSAYYQLFVGSLPGGRALVSSTFRLEGTKVSELTDIKPAAYDALTTLG